jgi:hypothetical protein
VEQDHTAFAGCKDDARNAVGHATANFPQFVVKLSDERHSQGPPELNGFDGFAENAPFCARERLQPFANWFVSGIRSKELGGKDWFRGIHS